MGYNTRNYKPSKPHKQAQQPENKDRGNAPSHIVYQVIERNDNKGSVWTRIGAAWPHQDGNGFNLTLSALPLDGRLTLRVPTDETEGQD